MRTLSILGAGVLTAVCVTGAPLGLAQVTVDLHALQALPDHPAVSRPPRPPGPVVSNRPSGAAHEVPAVATRQAPVVPQHEAPAVVAHGAAAVATREAPASASLPAAQPAMPQSVPDTASIAPVMPQAPPPGPPTAPPVSDAAKTAAASTPSGLRLTFAPGESDLSSASSVSIRQLTQAAAPGEETTFNVLAYAPGKPDDPSTARRISLSRAMAVRSALVADGVPSARIFVRALGEQYGDGPPDRVDVSVTGATTPTGTATTR